MLRPLQILRNVFLHKPSTTRKLVPTYQLTLGRYFANVSNCERVNDSAPVMTADKMRKVLELELDVMRQEGRKVPTASRIKEDHWQHLLQLKSRNQRRQYYIYLWNIEMAKENVQLRKDRKKIQVAQRKEELILANENNNHIIYGLFHNTMFLRIYDTTIDHFHNNKLIQAMQFGQNLIFDCSYDEYMNEKEMRNTAKQLMLCFAINRMHKQPFNIHHCNADFSRTTMKSLEKHLVHIRDPSFPFNISEQCYTKLFPKERLVYLTPHCRTDLKEFNSDDVYIVGAMVDKSSQEPISLGKAKKLGLRMARLPLDDHFQFKGGKSLTIDQMLHILLELKTSNNFERAFDHVPKRKIVPLDEEKKQMQQKLKERNHIDKFKFSMGKFSGQKFKRK